MFLGLGALAVFISYVAVMSLPMDSFGPLQVVGISLPGIVSSAVMIAYAAWEARNVSRAKAEAGDLSAQLARREIEIGRLSAVDELTGLATRREFEAAVKLELERVRRHEREFALLLIEIDDIAELGEAFGRLGKGYLMSELAGVLRHALRVNDVGCRYTGDQLALLLPETNAGQALAVAGTVRKAVAAHQFLDSVQPSGLSLTVSQGIAAYGPWVAKYTDILRATEQALVDARTAGFDQVMVYEPQPDAIDDGIDDAGSIERIAS